ncbi:hypothetical protein DY000_02053984 [Brassica cretica]|uniref:Uncharacterized protein n=1 Tax=Brassica cretica TaxID=69181 RepID=A0ABQ7AL20_BRACR|nr:hypothetical protein DY000_02053984 [Brassica cretica]
MTSHLSLVMRDRWIWREIAKTSNPNRERGFLYRPQLTNVEGSVGDPEHHHRSTVAHPC